MVFSVRQPLATAKAEGFDVEGAAQTLGVESKCVELLIGRGYVDLEAQQGVLQPKLRDLRVPEKMAGFHTAVDLITAALRHNWRLGIYGDYDVDGVATAASLAMYLREIGAQVVTRGRDTRRWLRVQRGASAFVLRSWSAFGVGRRLWNL